MKKFSVTYERWTEDDIEHGEASESGFVIQDTTLTDAIRLGLEYRYPSWSGPYEPNDSRADHTRWLSFYDWNEETREYYETGIREERALHIPDSVTPSSRKRIVRLFATIR